MIELRDDELRFSFPEVHSEAKCRIRFHRTLRIPDDNREYALPAGLGLFPVRDVDALGGATSGMRERGGVAISMHRAEALWIDFQGDYPMAVKIAAGKIDAITGEEWTEALSDDPQNYAVVPKQPWLDGYSVGEGRIRQFVAAQLGEGLTAEEQLTGGAESGGLQILVRPMRPSRWERLKARREAARRAQVDYAMMMPCFKKHNIDIPEMGLAAGGLMRQRIYKDKHGLKAWHRKQSSRCWVHIAEAGAWTALAGEPATTKPPTPADYARAQMPWFDYYDEGAALKGSKKLAGLDSYAAAKAKKGEKSPEGENPWPVPPPGKPIKPGDVVREGPF